VLDGTQAETLRALLAQDEVENETPDLAALDAWPDAGLARLLRRNPTEAERTLWTRMTNDKRFGQRGLQAPDPGRRHVPILSRFRCAW
jgi:tRNA/rRNA methyltransferase